MRLIDADKLIYQSHAQHIQPYINKKDIDNASTVEMADDCISRADTIKWLKKVTVTEGIEFKTGFEQIIYDIEQMPSVQPQPKRGKWIEDAETYYKMLNERGLGVDEYTPYFTDDIACSVCLAKYSCIDNETQFFKYCPNCGADMRDIRETGITAKEGMEIAKAFHNGLMEGFAEMEQQRRGDMREVQDDNKIHQSMDT